VALSLTFVNQVGAPEGLNQAAPGSFIPESFVRWAQDVLFDRVGYLRRRAPFEIFPLYNNVAPFAETQPSTANERIITVVSTNNPLGDKCTAMILTGDSPTATRALLYNEEFRNTGESTLVTITKDSIFDCKPASNGGLWLSFLESYKPAVGANEYYQYYWYGGIGTEQTVENTLIGCKYTGNVTHRTFTNKIYAPQFTVTDSVKTSNVVTLTFASHTISLGDTITVDMSDVNFDGTFTVTNVTSTTISYAFAGANVPSAADSGTVTEHFKTTELTAGMFVFVEYSSSDYYGGVLKTIDTTELTLEKDIIRWRYNQSVIDMGTSVVGTSPNERLTGVKIKFRNFRPYIHQHGRGLLNRTSGTDTSATSGAIGTEGEGHFQSADLSGVALGINWGMYRASDNEWIGDISTTSDNTSVAFDSSHHSNEADVILRGDEYVCWPYQAVPVATVNTMEPTEFAGIFNATYAGYQWYGNAANGSDHMRIVFSAAHNSEAVDLSKDSADSIIIPGVEMRGMATSSSGLIIFTDNKTFILRGNYRANFSLEELYPEGCLSSMSIVEYGGGVFWASRLGIMFYDGASVRNLTENNLGVYYTDSVRTFDVNSQRIYSFLHKDYLFVNFTAFDSVFKPARYEPIYADGIETTPAIADFAADDWDPDFTPDDFLVENNIPIYWKYIDMYASEGANSTKTVPIWGNAGTVYKWGSPGDQYVWGPTQKTEGITFAIYLPTNALTTLSNFNFKGATKIDAASGIKALMGANIVYGSNDIRPRLIDVDSILETSNNQATSIDTALIENNGKADSTYIKGPDFYFQTKHFTVGDPVIRKWFRQIMLNLYLLDGGIRMDVVDMEDADRIDVEKKRHTNWELFTEAGYSWDEFEDIILPKILSPNRSTWDNVTDLNQSWYEIADAEFTRRRKKISWRYPSIGFRLYQMNDYRPANYQTAQRPHTVMLDAWNIGFKPMRASRV